MMKSPDFIPYAKPLLSTYLYSLGIQEFIFNVYLPYFILLISLYISYKLYNLIPA